MSESFKIDYSQLFQLLPERYIAFLPNDPDFVFIDVNDAYLEMAMRKREEVIGKPFFEVFPDTSETYKKTGKSLLAESIRRVLKTKKPETLEQFRYDIRDNNGKLQLRYWEPSHYPILDKRGKVQFVLQVSKDVTHQVITDRRLAQTQKQLNVALSVGEVGIWNWDIVKEKIIADKNFERLFAIDPAKAAEGLSLRTFTNSIHPLDRRGVLEKLKKIVTHRGDFEEEFRTIMADGIVRWVLARGQAERNKNGKIAGFSGVVVDITDRKRTEEALQESEAQFKFLAESMPQKVFTATPDGKRDYFNPQWTEFTGIDTKTLEGWGWVGFIHPEDKEGIVKGWKHAVKTGMPFQREYRLRRFDGAYSWHLSRAHAMYDKHRKITKWIGSSTDISEQKQYQLNLELMAKVSKALASSLDHKLVLRKIAELAVPTLADWCVVDLYEVDREWEQVALIHKDPKKVKLVDRLRKLSPPEFSAPTGVPKVVRTGKAEFYPLIDDKLLEKTTRDQKHYQLLKQAGIVSSMIVPLVVNGKGIGAITFVSAEEKRIYTENDFEIAKELAARASQAMTNAYLYASAQEEIKKRTILEGMLRRANELLEARVEERTKRLEQANQEFQRSNRELQDFAYVASHDLQEPLRKIQAFGNLLEDEYGEQLGEGEDYLRRMRNAASRMSVLIEDLLSFSRVATHVRPFESVDLNVIVGEVVNDLEIRLKDTHGRVLFSRLPTIKADPLQMRQLLQNLIANALKFHREDENPVVRIEAKIKENKKQGESYCEISIKDNGIGFNEKYIDRIFSVFQRLHGRDAYEGTGIGLAVCRRIVERHDGTITAKSTLGVGSTFTIKIPISKGGRA